MHKKIASEIAVGIVLFVAVAVGGIFLLQARKVEAPAEQVAMMKPTVSVAQTQPEVPSSNSETIPRDWKTYSNGGYGFSVSYPDSWKFNELTLDNAFYQGIVFNESKEDPAHSFAQLAFFYYKSIDDKDNSVSWSNGSKQPKNLDEYMKDPMFKNAKAITFEGENAFSAVNSNNNTGKDKNVIFVEHNGHIYEITYASTDNDVDTINAVIKTFKFTDAQPADETANWQTYTNTKYGFQIKYPATGYEFHTGNPKDDEPQFFVKNSNDSDKSYYALDLDILPNDSQKYFEARVQEAQKTGQHYIATTVDGKPAYKNAYDDITVYEILDNETSFNIVFKNNDVGAKILSTMKFVK